MAIPSRKIFIDSSVFISFIDRADDNHSKVVKTFENLAGLRYQIFTSAQNLSEVYTAIAREIGVSVALDFLNAILQSDIEILFPQKADILAVNRILKGNKERQIPFRETLNATLMQKRGVNQILTFSYWHNLFGTNTSNLLT